MDTVDDYYNATAEQRARMLAKNTPPAAQTHRGKERSEALDGHHVATKAKRAATHRAPGPPRTPAHIPAWVRNLLASGKPAA